jgi:voltage-gated potassium channel
MTNIQRFKHDLNRVFDDKLHTKQWHNIVDYFIIGMILISTIEVFLSTYNSIMEQYGKWLHIIDYVTTAVFTIEVSLRIWCADLIDPKYKGFWGRVKYCFSFYGFIDIISTFPFYLNFVMHIPYVALKAFRIARLLRIFRYMKAFNVLLRVVKSKRDEMVVSLQFLTIVTLILSFILFFVEHEAQPEVYSNGLKSVVWSFAQYIGDPGNFADTPPITFWGRIIAVIIGVLGIAIFAVPAGLIGSGFSEIMEEDVKQESIANNIEKLKIVYERKLDRPTTFQVLPPYLSFCDIQARIGLKEDEIFDAVQASNQFRIINLAMTQTIDEHPQDKLAVEHFIVNRPYGCCIDRGSKITIVATSSFIDPCIGSFSYYIALIGGFNYISREVGVMRPYRSYYTFADRYNHEENLPLFMEDLERLTSRDGSWTLTSIVASGANEPAYPTIFHFTIGGAKGDESFEGENLVVQDTAAYRKFYEDVTAELLDKFGMASDHQRYHNGTMPNLYVRKFEEGKGSRNNIILRTAWSACLWDSRRIAIAKTIADALNRHFESDVVKEYTPDLKIKKSGY